jgi:DNA polymerase/3'-5' exonuclease PolX
MNYIKGQSSEEAINDMLRVRGVGEELAKEYYDEGIRSAKELSKSKNIPYKIKMCAKYVNELEEFIDRKTVKNNIAFISPFVEKAVGVGGYRRGKINLHDTDIFIISDTPLPELVKKYKNVLSVGEQKAEILIVEKHPTKKAQIIDLYKGTKEEEGAQLLHLTGPKIWNILLRIHAKKHFGYTLSQHGLFDKNKKLIACKTEKEILEKLNLLYVEPSMRGDDNVIHKLFGRKQMLSKILDNIDNII